MSQTTDEPATRGRPRSADRTGAILDAASDLLREVGYDALRMQDVAERAGAGLATIYRRWSTKEELIAAAIGHQRLISIEPTGDARADLRSMARVSAEELCKTGELMAGFMAAAHAHEILGEAVRAEAEVFRGGFSDVLGQLLGEDHPLIPTLADAIPSLLMMRSGMLGEEIDPDRFADEYVALVDAVAR
ncbi:MAG: TetR/AcrR family transcriptional regulator [Actinomycetota bacterium]